MFKINIKKKDLPPEERPIDDVILSHTAVMTWLMAAEVQGSHVADVLFRFKIKTWPEGIFYSESAILKHLQPMYPNLLPTKDTCGPVSNFVNPMNVGTASLFDNTLYGAFIKDPATVFVEDRTRNVQLISPLKDLFQDTEVKTVKKKGLAGIVQSIKRLFL